MMREGDLREIKEKRKGIRENIKNLGYEILLYEFKIEKGKAKILGVRVLDKNLRNWIISWLDLEKREIHSFRIMVFYE